MPDPAAERIGVESYFGISDFTRNTKIYETSLRNLEKKTASYGKSVEKSTEGAEVSWQEYARTLGVIVQRQERDINAMRKAMAGFTRQSRQGTQQAESAWKMFSQSVIGQVAKLRATMDAARFALSAFIKPFQQFIALGTEAVGLRRTQQRFAEMVGGAEAYAEALEGMREATQGTIKDADLISSAFNMLRRGYADTAESAAVLARNISLTAKMAGQVPTPEAAMQVFSLMMSNQSRMRVDAFGLTIEQVDGRIAQLKDTLGATEEEAFRLAIIQLLDEQVESLGLTAETATTKLDRARVTLGNLGDNLKTVLVPIFEDFVNVITGWADNINVNIENITLGWATFVGRLRGSIQVAGDHLHALVLGFMSVKEAMALNIDAAKDYWQAAGDMFERARSQASMWESIQIEIERHTMDLGTTTQDSASQQVEALGQVEQAWNDLADATQAYEDELAKVSEQATSQAAARMAQNFYKIQDAAIAAARRREDIARQTAARIQAIEAQLVASIQQAQVTYQNAITTAQQQVAEQRLQIDEDYHRRLRDIQRRYEMSSDQAIRERDALALSRARQQRDQELQEAEEQRTEQMSEAEQSYQQQVQAAEQALEQQIQAARDAYQEQIRELQASLQEQEAEYQRAQQRREEDEDGARAREEGKRRQAQGQKIAEIYLDNQQELAEAQAHYARLTGELRNYYNNVVQYYAAIASITGSAYGAYGGVGGPVAGYQQVGGYALTPGAYVRGETGREWTADTTTTRALEGALGGGITQTDIRSLASSIQSGTPATMNHNVSGRIEGVVDLAVRQGIAGMEGRLMAGLERQMRALFRVR